MSFLLLLLLCVFLFLFVFCSLGATYQFKKGKREYRSARLSPLFTLVNRFTKNSFNITEHFTNRFYKQNLQQMSIILRRRRTWHESLITCRELFLITVYGNSPNICSPLLNKGTSQDVHQSIEPMPQRLSPSKSKEPRHNTGTT